MIKEILDEISAESGDNMKMEILGKYKDNELLKRVLYLAYSKRVTFGIKQIPDYPTSRGEMGLDSALEALKELIERKETGHSAIGFLVHLLSSVTSDDAQVIEYIIGKSCKIDMGRSNINKVIKDLIEKTPYQGAISFAEKPAQKIFEENEYAFSDIKMDGRYCNGIVRESEVDMESREGIPTILIGSIFPKELEAFDDCVFNGELTIDGVSRYESNGMITSFIDITKKKDSRTEKEHNKKVDAFVKKHGTFEAMLKSVRYTVWDMLTVDEYFNKKSTRSYADRREALIKVLDEHKPTMISLVETRKVYSYAEAMEHFQEVVATVVDGVPMEGTILKDPSAGWKNGKVTYQVKMKLEMDFELKITGYNYGKKGTKNEFVISSFNAESACGLLKTRPQGLKEEMMRFVTENQDILLGKIIQCRSNGLSTNSSGEYSMLYPRFIMFRDDKDVADTLEQIKEIEYMVKHLATAA